MSNGANKLKFKISLIFHKKDYSMSNLEQSKVQGNLKRQIQHTLDPGLFSSSLVMMVQPLLWAWKGVRCKKPLDNYIIDWKGNFPSGSWSIDYWHPWSRVLLEFTRSWQFALWYRHSCGWHYARPGAPDHWVHQPVEKEENSLCHRSQQSRSTLPMEIKQAQGHPGCRYFSGKPENSQIRN